MPINPLPPGPVVRAPAVIQVVAGLLFRKSQLLVCQRRADGPFPLKWEFPGGKIEAGESGVAALARELHEELTVELRDAALVCSHDHLYPAGPQVSLEFYRVDFAGEPENRVFEQIRWCNLADLGQLDFLDGDRPVIERLMVEGEALLARGRI